MNKPCASCGGTGQIGSFLGVSRFLLTWEECSVCAGTGIAPAAEETERTRARQQGERGRGKRRRRR